MKSKHFPPMGGKNANPKKEIPTLLYLLKMISHWVLTQLCIRYYPWRHKCENNRSINVFPTFKILQARFQQYVNCELPDVQAGFRKGRGTRDQTVNIRWSWKKQESSRKTSISALLTMPKPLTVWITINCGNFWKRWEYQTTWPASWETCMQVRKQQLELDMEQQTGSK